MPTAISHMVDGAFEKSPIEEITQAPVAALQGVGSVTAQRLEQAVGATTIGELAQAQPFRYAQALQRATERRYDPGPTHEWGELLLSAPHDVYLSEAPIGGNGVSRIRHEFGPVYYRGRLDGTARLLIVGQDPAANELIARRAFVGDAGQKLQGLLGKLGITRSYLIVNTFTYSIYDQFDSPMKTFSSHPALVAWRKSVFERALSEGGLDAVLCFGSAAKHAVGLWSHPAKPPVFHFIHPSSPATQTTLKNWSDNLQALAPLVTPDDPALVDLSPYGTTWTGADEQPIPRFDMPFGCPTWHGNGSHAFRGKLSNGSTNPKELFWQAP